MARVTEEEEKAALTRKLGHTFLKADTVGVGCVAGSCSPGVKLHSPSGKEMTFETTGVDSAQGKNVDELKKKITPKGLQTLRG